MNRYKILFLDEIGRIDGAEVVLYNLVTRLDKDHFDPIVVCGSEGKLVDRLRSQNIPVHVLPMQETSPLILRIHGGIRLVNPLSVVKNVVQGIVFGVKFFRFLSQNPPDLVHTNTLLSNLFGSIPVKLLRKPLVWHEHNIQPKGFRRQVVNIMGRLFPDRVLTISNAVRQAYGWKPNARRLVTIYNGIDLEEYRPSQEQPGLRSQFNIPDHCQVVAITAPLRPWKGHKHFLIAAKEILSTYTSVRFLIVGGEIFGKDRGYKDYLLKLRATLGIEQYVFFAGFRTDIPKILSVVDVFVSTSVLPEPFSLVVLEAMASGKPVVATRTGGVPEVVDDGVTGFLVQPENSTELSSAILSLLTDKQTATAMGSAGRRRAEQFFALPRFVRDVEAVYVDVLKEHREQQKERAG